MNVNLLLHAVSESCSDTNDIRLTQYTDDNLGRLEVCSGGIWGSVCGNGATNDIATVACRQLGHAAEGEEMFDVTCDKVPCTYYLSLCRFCGIGK